MPGARTSSSHSVSFVEFPQPNYSFRGPMVNLTSNIVTHPTARPRTFRPPPDPTPHATDSPLGIIGTHTHHLLHILPFSKQRSLRRLTRLMIEKERAAAYQTYLATSPGFVFAISSVYTIAAPYEQGSCFVIKCQSIAHIRASRRHNKGVLFNQATAVTVMPL